MTRSQRNWCAVIQYPGKKPVLFGHACVDGRAAHREVEAELARCISSCVPDGWKMVDMIPGTLIFTPEGEGSGDV